MSKRKVAYYYDSDVGAYTYGLGHPMKPHRIRVTHDLVTAYGMLDKMHILKPKRASPEVMSSFHTDEYVHFLTNVTPETADKLTYSGTRFLVGEDNPAFDGLFEFCSISAGGSIGAAQRITSGAADIAINWAGGLHHAKKREASGFCYINDIVLGVLELLRTYPRVLYIDIDCHHGDGVEEAFYTTDRVMTCSFHKFGEYFPGTGSHEDRGRGKERDMQSIPLRAFFRPSAVVLQCGADSLAGDKLGCFNITMHGHASCAQFLRKQNIPLIMVGGGGYTVKNVARTWAYETACALGIEDDIDPMLPWNPYFEWFGPRYRLEVPQNNMEDLNVKDGSIDIVREKVLEQLQSLHGPPSVQMQDVPRESLGQHLGFSKDDESAKDELDKELAQHVQYVYDLQTGDTTTDESSESDHSWDSDDSLSSGSNTRWRQGTRSPRLSSPSATRVNGRNGASKRKRMSLLTGQYFDIPLQENGYEHYDPCAPPDGDGDRDAAGNSSVKRRFFMSLPPESGWDSLAGGGGYGVDDIVSMRRGIINGYGHYDFGSFVNGGAGVDVEGDDDADDDDEGMVVD
ncbi:hypothetical protein CPB84DRAFT_1800914 [Gymnopilus junonius]|uniref:histone deacetylase n=1 Tax=Gymnopilus junonius TaxID=109634 RepID=A0A9P5N918_GYMJU|nr:hypothetical protein CPB84DRAFT_1800914 [Gymnopilus junonius]